MTKNFFNRSSASLSLLFLSAIPVSPAFAETINCTPITSVPTTINTPGTYCLTGNISTSMSSGTAIEIQTSDVSLDLNGFYIENTIGGTSHTSYGISSGTSGTRGSKVHNGTVRGFTYGVYLKGGSIHSGNANTVQDMRIDGSLWVGIWAEGNGAVVRDNMVYDTGETGTTITGATGIAVDGEQARVVGNLVFNTVTGTGLSPIGIEVFSLGTMAADIRDNVVVRTTSGTPSMEIGYKMAHTGGANLMNNFLIDSYTGFSMIGTDKYIGNLTAGTTVPFSSGIAVGHNN